MMHVFFLVSSCLNDYFHVHMIDFLANKLVFPNMVTYLKQLMAMIICKKNTLLVFSNLFEEDFEIAYQLPLNLCSKRDV